MGEITVPETKPATEWVNGRALQKLSPRRKHALAQGVFFSALHQWACKKRAGRVGTEWDFRIAPPGEDRRPLVPDVAYLSYDRVAYDRPDDADIPRVAPDAVVEVLSPGDAPSDVNEKVRVYLSAGTRVVFLVDTLERKVTSMRPDGSQEFKIDECVRDPALPGFALLARELFEDTPPR